MPAMPNRKPATMSPSPQPIANQRGAALLVGLIILILLTLIGLAGINSATLQERMAGNHLMHQNAFQSAEGTLRDAERGLLQEVRNQTFTPDFNADSGNPTDANSIENWISSNPTTERSHRIDVCQISGLCSLDAGVGGNTEQPDYVIQISLLAFDRPTDPNSAVVLQGIYIP